MEGAAPDRSPGQATTDPVANPAAEQEMLQQQAEAYQQTLATTPAAAMAQTAAAVAVAPPMGPLPPPTLLDCVLVDHSSAMCLFGHFMQAAALGDSLAMDMVACALALELRLHSHAELAVLYPILQTRLGDNGRQWAIRAAAEHTEIEQSVADVMALRGVGGQALVNRVKQMQAEFTAHQMEEESTILPAVASALSEEESVQLVSQWKTAKQLAPLQPQTPAVLAAAAAASAGVMSGEGTGVGAGPGTVATGREGAGKAAQRGPEEEAVFEAEA